ncbi:hypothetical protein [Iningainema tapete]|uniref:Uncharacterized protein n=1 Tax=Iningainema tapete BLCC-T55 TaxID=2748662 RepID=A0A8J6XES7_9CYAN|nr:hypothetical protein [Iningainema tapete]MBD2771146.1 hypothetical protein [Iningainema tapete BLCC-T55]
MDSQEEPQVKATMELSPVAKTLVGVITSIIGFLSISTWNTVNNSALDIARLQVKSTIIEEKISNIKDTYQEKNEDTNKRITTLEARMIAIEKRTKRNK